MNINISIILLTPDTYATIRTTVQHLARQTVCDEIELLIVAPSNEKLALVEADVSSLGGVRIVEVGQMISTSRAKVVAIEQATAPIIALSEDHVFPDPDWAEALIRAHEHPHAVVGPVVYNANPETLVSWADFVIGYGPWMPPQEGGSISFLPGHNSAYKKEILLAYGEDLEAMLDAETVLHWDLGKKGHTLYLEPKARIGHLNFAAPSIWFGVQVLTGRAFAASRARNWSIVRRLAFAAGSPLIPFVRFGRLWGGIARGGRLRTVPPLAWPVVLLGLMLDGLGQGLGYAFGAGHVMDRLVDVEFDRVRYA